MTVYLAWASDDFVIYGTAGPWEAVRQLDPRLLMIHSTDHVESVVDSIRARLPPGVRLLVAPLGGVSATDGLAADEVRWLRNRVSGSVAPSS